jgi:hypothetical protein
MNFKHGWIQLFIACDQLANVLTNPFSSETWADETLSSRCGRLGHRYPYKFWIVVVDIGFYWQTWSMGHCVRAMNNERARTQLPPRLRINSLEK